ncbi:hypothetical protein [Citreimonas salinaria]|uniref:Uncharacterized protein n=1 Tax=Citreimonas salinaria TaxID=321339 RepID=A0A1H3NJ81_9RHOB|nr:hypothetical protein [Citreimonas salinaria]SDY88289.1 hypothetical protein SAMN05444340_12424 [Citreimonas salinaria]
MEISKDIKKIARTQGYTKADLQAGLAFAKRKNRDSNPPGDFDSAGRFYAHERTRAVESVRSPSRAFPYSQMTAARTVRHCAEVFGAEELHVKRIAKAIETCSEAPATAKEAAEQLAAIRKTLKTVKLEIAEAA